MHTHVPSNTQDNQGDPQRGLHSRQTKVPTVMERSPPPIPYHTRPVSTPVTTVKSTNSLKSKGAVVTGDPRTQLSGSTHSERSLDTRTAELRLAEPAMLHRRSELATLHRRSHHSAELAEPETLHRRELAARVTIKGEVGVDRHGHPASRRDSYPLHVNVESNTPAIVKIVHRASGGDSNDPVYSVEQSVRRMKLDDESCPRQRSGTARPFAPAPAPAGSDSNDPAYWVEQSFRRLKLDDETRPRQTSRATRLFAPASAPSGSVSSSVSLDTRTGYALWPSDSEVSEDDTETRHKKYYVVAQGRRPGIYDSCPGKILVNPGKVLVLLGTLYEVFI
ncbi:hypothetical protein JOM56_001741 [Amanita muscaria]